MMTVAESLDIVAVQGCPCFIEFGHGSAMEEEDFLHLKAVWQNVESTNKSQAHIHLRLGAWFNKASQDLDNYPDFNRYLSAVQRRDAPSSRIGMFWAAYEQQCQVAKSLHATSKVKKAYGMNEELVNMSLVNFIQAVCACHPGLDINCNPARVHLTFDFRRVKDEKQAKAIDSNPSLINTLSAIHSCHTPIKPRVEMPPKKTMTVPATVEDWEQAVHPDGTTIVDINASIHDQYKLQSSSAMEEEDFLHLKAVWQNVESTDKSQAHSCENAGLPTLIRVWERTSSFCCWIVRS
ncbi:unnamed protein product [Penicillium roqueforti FM164]|uniref:Uncharacterized protein n=1 Tax=Penicillium roqueforti (strain FM164) TaxID=1365484 RepID=W6QKC6_PENRF|nr:unnamed protein product [Penicillium roqueforti FM164]